MVVLSLNPRAHPILYILLSESDSSIWIVKSLQPTWRQWTRPSFVHRLLVCAQFGVKPLQELILIVKNRVEKTSWNMNWNARSFFHGSALIVNVICKMSGRFVLVKQSHFCMVLAEKENLWDCINKPRSCNSKQVVSMSPGWHVPKMCASHIANLMWWQATWPLDMRKLF